MTKQETANLIVYDVGSTYTKLAAFRLVGDELSYLGRSQAPTTLDDVMIGVGGADQALQEQKVSVADNALRYSTCSAAGGLRMVAMGYMPRVTAKAAKEVAMNAGARVLEVISHEDSPSYRLEILREIRPDLILLAGGTDGGERKSAVENAHLIQEAGMEGLVVVACNKEAQGGVCTVLEKAGISYAVTPNIMPTIHTLNVKTARDVIHREFIKQLTRAKGLEALTRHVTDRLVRPTPGAVLMAAELWSKGTHRQSGFGDVMLIDVGGATTDIHSVLPEVEKKRPEEIGLIISNEKQASYRTVEGNLGLRVSATGIVDTVGAEGIAEHFSAAIGIDKDYIQQYTSDKEKRPETLAQDDRERQLDRALAIAAIHTAVRRHAGHIAETYDPLTGVMPGFPTGRDLRHVTHVIGVGGIFSASSEAERIAILDQALSNPGLSLLPEKPMYVFDDHYLMFALGTLANYYPDAVFSFMKSAAFSGKELKP